MRAEKTIDLGEYKVTLKEIRAGDVRNFLKSIRGSRLFEDGKLNSTTLFELITEYYDAVEPLLKECLIFSEDGLTFDDLSLSDTLKVFEDFLEVNPVFLSLVGQMAKWGENQEPGSTGNETIASNLSSAGASA